MYKEKTVFIIGAGASADYNFPIGETLKQNIINIYNQPNDTDFGHHLNESFSLFGSNFFNNNFQNGNRSVSLDDFYSSALKLTNTLETSDSIDRALQTYENDETIRLLGKLSIVHEILKAERKSEFLATQTHNFGGTNNVRQVPIDKFSNNPNLRKTWIHKFFRLLVENYPLENCHNIFENISIICFNYDRCIEYYLTELIIRHFGIERKAAEQTVRTLPIFHPYGTVGQLFEEKENYMPFGGIGAHQTKWIDFSSTISTFTESAKINSKKLTNYRNKIKEARNIVHIGFGLENMNCDLFTDNGNVRNIGAQIYSTAFGQTTDQIEDFKNELSNVYRNKAAKTVYNMNGSQLLTHISRRIKK